MSLYRCEHHVDWQPYWVNETTAPMGTSVTNVIDTMPMPMPMPSAPAFITDSNEKDGDCDEP